MEGSSLGYLLLYWCFFICGLHVRSRETGLSGTNAFYIHVSFLFLLSSSFVFSSWFSPIGHD